MGCANCKKKSDAKDPTLKSSAGGAIIIANANELKDIAHIKKMIEKHGPEYLDKFITN